MKKKFFVLSLVSLLFYSFLSLPTLAVNKFNNLNTVPVSDVYKKGFYNFNITYTSCEAIAKLVSTDKNAVIMVVNSDNTLRLFKKCTPNDPTILIGNLTKNDTVIIIGEGEFSIKFIRNT